MPIEAPAGECTLVVLFGGRRAMRVATDVRRALLPETAGRVNVAVPPVGGTEFLAADGEYARALTAWWNAEVGPRRMPVFVAMDEPDLPRWMEGIPGTWYVGVADDTRALAYDAVEPRVFPAATTDENHVAEEALHAIATALGVARVVDGGYAFAKDPGPPSRGAGARPSEDAGQTHSGHEPRPAPRRIMRRVRGALAVTQEQANAIRKVTLARVQPRDAASIQGLGQLVNAHRPMLVAFGSRKGGVGKTTHAAAVAAIIGEALDGLPDTAALVDANITNPDSWALNPAPGTATVRLVLSRLAAGDDPPDPLFAATPRLAIYPESRSADDCYTKGEVDLLAGHLRRRHSFVAVDLPNALPSLASGGAPAVTASWLLAVDAVVLPFNADPRARQGTLEYLDVLRNEVGRDVPVIAPYVVARNRDIARDRGALADVEAVRRAGGTVIEVPEDDRALVALLRDRSIARASAPLRRAYAALARAVVEGVIHPRAAA